MIIKEVHSAGVHETASGGLKVYSEEEKLVAKISHAANTHGLVV